VSPRAGDHGCPDQFVQLGLIPGERSGHAAAESNDDCYRTDGQPFNQRQQAPTT
jgi:hypothetical protein